MIAQEVSIYIHSFFRLDTEGQAVVGPLRKVSLSNLHFDEPDDGLREESAGRQRCREGVLRGVYPFCPACIVNVFPHRSWHFEVVGVGELFGRPGSSAASGRWDVAGEER